ncbi:MAG: hypothetical protein C4320_03515 [Armatimonadota bacterium]
MTPELSSLVFGTEAPPLPPIKLTAGRLSAEFEPTSGMLRYVQWDTTEVLRGIYANVRRADWSTVDPVLSDVEVEENESHFRVLWSATHVASGVDFSWRGEVSGDDRGNLTYRLDGEPSEDLVTNRTGICILHPATLAGTSFTAFAAGQEQSGEFPTLIAPDVLLTDLEAITYAPGPGITSEIKFEGDRFETEDQRNWGDNSYKSYVYPQTRPMPYTLAAGQSVRQGISLQIHVNKVVSATSSISEAVIARKDDETRPVPALQMSESVVEATDFPDLNRNRPDPNLSVRLRGTPQTHLRDPRTLFENVITLRDQANSARRFTKGSVSLNPYEFHPGGDDPRWNSLLGLAWSVAACAAAMRANFDGFSIKGMDDPAVLPHLLWDDLQGACFEEAKIICGDTSPEPQLAHLTLRAGNLRRVILANLTPNIIPFPVSGDLSGAEIFGLDETNVSGTPPPTLLKFIAATPLPPYAYRRIDARV